MRESREREKARSPRMAKCAMLAMTEKKGVIDGFFFFYLDS